MGSLSLSPANHMNPTVLTGLGPELYVGQTVFHVPDFGGSLGTYNSGTRTMSNGTAGPFGYPRFQFDVGMEAGKSYRVSGLLSGDIGVISGIRLAISGSANNIAYDPGTGVFAADQVAAQHLLEFFGDGSLFSITIADLSVRRIRV